MIMGGKRNLVLGRLAGVLFLCGAAASLPATAVLGGDTGDYLVNALALAGGLICFAIPWGRLDARWLHVLVVVANAGVIAVVVVHHEHGMVFSQYFVLVAVFAAYAFRRRDEALVHLLVTVACMAAASVWTASNDSDALAHGLVGIPTVCVTAGLVIWLREGLERRERTDPLTGLGNRRALMEALEEACAQGLGRLLVLFDLDGFKAYNDRLGHAAGDALLTRVGIALGSAADGRGETFRLGGDELCVLLADDRALPDCAAALRDDGITASHGSASIPHEAVTPSAALSLADSRMYAAKHAARQAPFVLTMGSSASASASASRRPSAAGSASPPGSPSAALASPPPADRPAR